MARAVEPLEEVNCLATRVEVAYFPVCPAFFLLVSLLVRSLPHSHCLSPRLHAY